MVRHFIRVLYVVHSYDVSPVQRNWTDVQFANKNLSANVANRIFREDLSKYQESRIMCLTKMSKKKAALLPKMMICYLLFCENCDIVLLLENLFLFWHEKALVIRCYSLVYNFIINRFFKYGMFIIKNEITKITICCKF